MENLARTDPEVADAIRHETVRQGRQLEMIASENFVSEAVLEAAGTILTNKYAEGYPGKRYYGGCGFYDEIEKLAIERAKKRFGEPRRVLRDVLARRHRACDAPRSRWAPHARLARQLLGEALQHRRVRRA